ncbi:MAG: barstar family protein [Lachnospiraceae bacterium]|nr:barstar family protein [Lachnospiraceae bacterium]
MTEYEFDLSGCFSPDDIHGLIAEKLPLPEYYGGNLDALYDVLTEISGVKIVFGGTDAAVAIVGEKYMRRFKKMCDNAAEENKGIEIVFL